MKLFNDKPVKEVTVSTITGAMTGAAVGIFPGKNSIFKASDTL